MHQYDVNDVVNFEHYSYFLKYFKPFFFGVSIVHFEQVTICWAGTTKISLYPFLANVPILYPLKTPENQRFSSVFRRYKIGTLARNELMRYGYEKASSH